MNTSLWVSLFLVIFLEIIHKYHIHLSINSENYYTESSLKGLFVGFFSQIVLKLIFQGIEENADFVRPWHFGLCSDHWVQTSLNLLEMPDFWTVISDSLNWNSFYCWKFHWDQKCLTGRLCLFRNYWANKVVRIIVWISFRNCWSSECFFLFST